MNVLIIGGGMITREVLIPAVTNFFRNTGKGNFSIASRRSITIKEIETEFPGLRFDGYPSPANHAPDRPVPDAYKEALDRLKPPAAVIVATPDHFHTEPVLEAMGRGFDCIVQKPLCLTVADAEMILKKSRERGIYVYTDYHKRHDKAIRAVKYRYSTGEMGEALASTAYIEERREMPLKNFAAWCEKSSSFEYIGCHYVDAYYFITGLKPVSVTAFGQKKLLPSLGKDAYDAVEAIIEWENGSVQYVQTSWVLPDGNPNLTNQGFQITCTQGEFRSDNADRNSNFCTQSKGYDRFNPYFYKPFNDPDVPQKTVWEGYGIDSVLQPLNDIYLINAAVMGLSPAKALQKRKKMLKTLDAVRPLPGTAIIGTAVIEAVRKSLAGGNKRIDLRGLFKNRMKA